MYHPEIVLAAALMTLGITVSLTLYAMTTKTDFTMMGGTLFIFSAAFILATIIRVWMGDKLGPIWHLIFCTIGVILYGFYLIYDI